MSRKNHECEMGEYCPTCNLITCSGFLQQRLRFGRWKRRWFKLYQKGRLLIYEDETAKTLVSDIDTGLNCYDVQHGLQSGKFPPGIPRICSFVVILSKTKLYLYATSVGDTVKWVKALKASSKVVARRQQELEQMQHHLSIYRESGLEAAQVASGIKTNQSFTCTNKVAKASLTTTVTPRSRDAGTSTREDNLPFKAIRNKEVSLLSDVQSEEVTMSTSNLPSSFQRHDLYSSNRKRKEALQHLQKKISKAPEMEDLKERENKEPISKTRLRAVAVPGIPFSASQVVGDSDIAFPSDDRAHFYALTEPLNDDHKYMTVSPSIEGTHHSAPDSHTARSKEDLSHASQQDLTTNYIYSTVKKNKPSYSAPLSKRISPEGSSRNEDCGILGEQEARLRTQSVGDFTSANYSSSAVESKTSDIPRYSSMLLNGPGSSFQDNQAPNRTTSRKPGHFFMSKTDAQATVPNGNGKGASRDSRGGNVHEVISHHQPWYNEASSSQKPSHYRRTGVKYKSSSPSPRIPGQSPRIPAQSPRIPAQSPRIPAQSPRIPAQSPRIPAQSPRIPAQSPRIPAQSPRIPAQSPRIPAQSPRIPAQSPRIPAQSPRIPAQSPPRIPAQSPRTPTWSPRIPTQSSNQMKLHRQSEQCSNETKLVSHVIM